MTIGHRAPGGHPSFGGILPWAQRKSVSFLRYSDHGFALAPYEPIDREEYERRLAVVKGGDAPIELVGVSTIDEADCVGGACPVR